LIYNLILTVFGELSVNDSTSTLVGDVSTGALDVHRSAIPLNKKYSNAQPLWHLILLDSITFGFYFFYWSYRNWKHLNDYKNLGINPIEKALFLLIPIVGFAFAWEQFVAFDDFSKETKARTTFSPVWMMTGFIVFNIMWRLPDPYLLLGFLTVAPIALVQRSLNSAWVKVEPGLTVRKLPTIGDLLAVIASWGVIVIVNIIFDQIF
jgi:hypothetical protein